MLLYRCSHEGCTTEKRICVVCEYGGIRPPVPFTQPIYIPPCHPDGMKLADPELTYA
ncbi:MAG TPA: hypothetical protein VJN21_06565 [Candidatus Acidoferrales bacterium]|nr:hypothetical protein [Candidatus Acidoferrales bacterium]